MTPVSVSAGAILDERPGAGDYTGIGQRVAAVEYEKAVVDDAAGDRFPVVPPLPICSAPVLMVVPPV